MKDATAVWAKLFLILIISAKPLNGLAECKPIGNNSCLNHYECCSRYCFKEPGWELGICKRSQSRNADNPKEEEFVFETGVCAYYQGAMETANGEEFNDNGLTAAHQTLPFNTMVNVEVNGANVVVRINDRKDDLNGHILDMSFAAAESVGITDEGEVPCKLKIVTGIGCTGNYGHSCVMHNECCSQHCFREMFSEVGVCTPMV